MSAGNGHSLEQGAQTYAVSCMLHRSDSAALRVDAHHTLSIIGPVATETEARREAIGYATRAHPGCMLDSVIAIAVPAPTPPR